MNKTFPYFVRLARFCTMTHYWGWATSNSVPSGNGYSSTVLARRLCDAQVLIKAVTTYVYRCSHGAHAAVVAHIEHGKVEPGGERALAKGKRLVWDYLKQAAETEKVLSQRT